MDWTFKFTDLLIALATFCGPIAAIQIQKVMDRHREQRSRRTLIFRTLMATGAARLATGHVEALNAIPVEFFSHKDITEKWKEYLDSLLPNPHVSAEYLGGQRTRLFNELLFKISTFLKYPFSELEISREVYSPEGHAKIETEQTIIREGFAKIFSGKATIPMSIVHFPSDEKVNEEQGRLREVIFQLLNGEQSLKVDMISSANTKD